MGCGASRTTSEGLDKPIDFVMAKFQNDDIDQYFHDQEWIVQRIEMARDYYKDWFDQLAVLSGACVLDNYDLTHIYLGYLVNCELELQGFTDKLKVTDNGIIEPNAHIERNARLDKGLYNFLYDIHNTFKKIDPLDKNNIRDKVKTFERRLVEKYKGDNAKMYI
jgi:hypothetical protein